MRPFLRAHWSHLCVISFEVPADLLTPHVPRGLILDDLNGKHHVSLVAFDFENARVRGIAWPFHSDFPEVNLRFYVRGKPGELHAGKRGVCFLREFVPRRLISWVARRFFNEPYEPAQMSSQVHRNGDGLEVIHKFRHHQRWQEIRLATTRDPPMLPQEDSVESYFIDHTWGFGRDRMGVTTSYRVIHPRWLTYHVQWAEVRVNWAKTYGPQWKFLEHAKPVSTILAEGSDVAVYPAEVA